MGVILYILSIALSLILIPIGFMYGFFAAWYKRKFWQSFRGIANKFKRLAVAIDRYGNVACKELFNATLIKPNGHQFGDDRETISSALGRNKLANTLTKTGSFLCNILDTLDHNHVIKNIGY